MNRPNPLRALRRALALLVLGCAAHASAAGNTVSEQLVVAGAVTTSLRVGVDELRAFPAAQIVSVVVTRRVGGSEVSSTVRGVLLTALLERAGLAATGRNDWRHTYVLATATDGYKVVFSWPELFNSEIGAGAIVVFERDGQPLADREGRIALLSARDTRSGPRSVHWLARLEVRVVAE